MDKAFTTFKAEIITDGRFGECKRWPRDPLELLKVAVEISLLAYDPAVVKAVIDKASSELLASLAKPRRKVGDIVQVADEPGRWRIARDPSDPCVRCENPDCREWPNLEEIGEDGTPTGDRIFHIPECEMS